MISQGLSSCCAEYRFWRTRVSQGDPLGGNDSSVCKESTCNAGDPSSISGLGRSAGEGIGYPLQYSGLENSMDCVVHGVTKLGMTVQLSLSFSSLVPGPLGQNSCLLSFPVSESFPTSQFFASGGQNIGASASVLPVNIKG